MAPLPIGNNDKLFPRRSIPWNLRHGTDGLVADSLFCDWRNEEPDQARSGRSTHARWRSGSNCRARHRSCAVSSGTPVSMLCVTTMQMGRFIRDIAVDEGSADPLESAQRFLRLGGETWYWSRQ